MNKGVQIKLAANSFFSKFFAKSKSINFIFAFDKLCDCKSSLFE